MDRIKWNLKAFEEIRRLPSVNRILENAVSDVLGQLGNGYEGDVEAGRTRSRGYVVTSTPEGMHDNAANNSLVRALSNAHQGGI